MEAIATKFVKHDVSELKELSNYIVYELREKINAGKKLTRNEKNWITKNINSNSNSFFKDAIPLHGWRFDFSDILKTYGVRQYGSYREYRAIDRTSLRSMLYDKIDAILEHNDKN